MDDRKVIVGPTSSGKTTFIFNVYHPEDAKRIEEMIEKGLDIPKLKYEYFIFDTKVKHGYFQPD